MQDKTNTTERSGQVKQMKNVITMQIDNSNAHLQAATLSKGSFTPLQQNWTEPKWPVVT